ncbi:hypothetical protein ACFOSV_04680 [Algoriphagus namhaensis]|uniref:6-bladed beta-propeller protein n=1 Tax=Algoriphagus namhaensis TaxID=915353 RepID=A0ABV8ANZ1_9BACT
MMRKLIPCYLLLFILACQRPSEYEDPNKAQNQTFRLEKTDSVTVKDILARVFLFQGSVNDRLIFRDRATSEVYSFDQNGELLDQWNKEGDVPGKFGMASGNFAFDQAGNFVVLDIMNGLKLLKPGGEVIQDFGIYQNQVSLGGAFTHFDTEQLIKKGDEEYLLYSLDIIEEYYNNYDAEFLKERKNLLMTNIATNETQQVIPFPESSNFLNGNVFYFRDFRPVFHFDQNEEILYLMYMADPTLYIYDWSGELPVLKEEKALELTGFEIHEGFEPGAVGLGQINDNKKRSYPSLIQNISKFGENLLITYNPSPKDKPAIERVLAGDATDETKAKLREQYKSRTAVLRPDGQVISLDLPEMYYNSFKVIDEEIFWMKKPDPDIEAEEFTLYRGKLVSE